MIHTYTLLDKTAAERVWRVRWRKAIQNRRSAWFTSKTLERDGYDSDRGTLRELIAFSVDPEPTNEEVESMLDSESVATTMRRCHPQFWTMEEVLRRLHPRHKLTWDVELKDCSCLISVMSRAFLERRITASQMWSVVKLHNLGVSPWLDVDARTRQKMKQLPWSSLWKPIFSWQDENAFRGDESTNCLSVAQTRQFCALVERAYREDWETLSPRVDSSKSETLSFRGHPESVSFARSLSRGVAHFEQHPSVYRMLM